MDDDGDLHEQILHIEAHIEDLTDIIERCRKIILISKVAIAVGGILILTTVIGAVGFDPTVSSIWISSLFRRLAIRARLLSAMAVQYIIFLKCGGVSSSLREYSAMSAAIVDFASVTDAVERSAADSAANPSTDYASDAAKKLHGTDNAASVRLTILTADLSSSALN